MKIKEVEERTKVRVNNLVNFYKTANRFPKYSNVGEEELAETVCHVRHCDNSDFGYPSLRDRYPKQCEKILEAEKNIFVREKMKILEEFFLKNLNQPPKLIKKEVEFYAYWLWAKANREYLKEKNIPHEFVNIEEEMEISVEHLQIPSKKSMKEVFAKDKKLSSDYTKIEELLPKVKYYHEMKKSLIMRMNRFMEDAASQNYRIGLELGSTMNTLIDCFEILRDYLMRKQKTKDKETNQEVEITMLDSLFTNSYIKDIRENYETRMIEFIGTYVPSEEGESKKPKRKYKKKFEEED